MPLFHAKNSAEIWKHLSSFDTLDILYSYFLKLRLLPSMIDSSSGILIYTITALIFNQAFSPWGLGLGIFFALSPDLDFIPFALLRRRFRLVSHWFIHYPLLYPLIGGVIVYALGGVFFLLLFSLGSLAHFIHDSMDPAGVQWLWPLSRRAWTIQKGAVAPIEAEKHEHFHDHLIESIERRSIFDEVWVRLRPELKGRSFVYLLFSLTMLALFIAK